MLATWLTHRTQAGARWLERDALRREDPDKEFVEVAARCYVHALRNEEADIPGLVDLYGKIDRMRIPSSTTVVEIAERSRERSSTLIRNRTRASSSCGK
jgi:hypothetical protein